MPKITTVVTPNLKVGLTTLDRVKAELGITANVDDLLKKKIKEASSDIEGHCGRIFRKETLQEQFWGVSAGISEIILDRYPVSMITSIMLDGLALTSTDYRLDAEAGILYRLDPSGYPCHWSWCKDLMIQYQGGFVMPEDTGSDLPDALESGCVDLVSSFWLRRGRDPLVKAESYPDVVSREYWVGSVGADGELPSSVQEKVMPFRRASL